jgi:hypothetical protein
MYFLYGRIDIYFILPISCTFCPGKGDRRQGSRGAGEQGRRGAGEEEKRFSF